MHTTVSPKFDQGFCEQLTDLFRWRRDTRRFRTDPIPEALIEEALALACLAPSVGNSQPWRFVRVEDESRRNAVRQNFVHCNAEALAQYTGDRAQRYARLKLAGFDQAPVHLAVFCERNPKAGHGLGRQTMPETLAYSVVAAVQQFWLATRMRGLGVGWVSIIDPDEVKQILEVPGTWRLIAYLCVGWPEEEHLDPELERAGWQARMPHERWLYRR